MLRARPIALTEEVEDLVRGICFKTGPPRSLGVELEWLVHELQRPRAPRHHPTGSKRPTPPCGPCPCSSALTVEPGGQLELSSPPAASLMECVGSVSADLDAVRAVTAPGTASALVGLGHDPWHPPRRLLHEPRYDAMEAYFDRTGPAGPRHDVHLRLRAGLPGRRARGAGPARLRAALAAGASAGRRCWWPRSPTPRCRQGRPTGWRSTRQALWAAIGRRARAGAPPLDGDPRAAWARHVLDAPVMCVRRRRAARGTVPGRAHLPRRGPRRRAPRPPTRDDLDYHLTPCSRRSARAAIWSCA